MATERGVIEVRDLRQEEIPQAVEVIGRGMRDNPLHVVVYGEEPDRRLRCHTGLMRGVLAAFTAMESLCAVQDGVVVGVTGVAPVGTCRPTPSQRLRVMPRLIAMGPRTALRVLTWTTDWAKRDLDEPHVHLGPLAVDADLQGQGIGSMILREHCRRLDAAGEVGYLETDKIDNVRFYQRFGFEVITQADVLGVPNWFMRRPAGTE